MPRVRITTPFACKRPFHWISMKSRLARVARDTSKFQNWTHLTTNCHCYMAEVFLQIRRKTLSNQSIRMKKIFFGYKQKSRTPSSTMNHISRLEQISIMFFSKQNLWYLYSMNNNMSWLFSEILIVKNFKVKNKIKDLKSIKSL